MHDACKYATNYNKLKELAQQTINMKYIWKQADLKLRGGKLNKTEKILKIVKGIKSLLFPGVKGLVMQGTWKSIFATYSLIAIGALLYFMKK